MKITRDTATIVEEKPFRIIYGKGLTIIYLNGQEKLVIRSHDELPILIEMLITAQKEHSK